MASLLSGTAFITGAASGIGAATARQFAKYGINGLALADIDLAALTASGQALAEAFPHVQILNLHVDVASSESVRAGLAQAAAHFGRIDVAVNNAGVGGSGRATHEIDEEEWRRIVNINLDGVWRCQKEEIGILLAQDDRGPRIGRGRIINTSSAYGLVGPSATIGFAQTAYAASKHGVVGLTRADANTYGPRGIRINAVCPGYVQTPILKQLIDDPTSPFAQEISRIPLGRLSTPDEMADVMVFLASPLSSFMQGAALVADGGMMSQ